MRRAFYVVPAALFLLAITAGPTLATIHPLVESYDCANAQAFDHHPLGDIADPIGQTPGVTPGEGKNALRAVWVTSDGFTDFTSPAWFGHKLDGQCGHAGP